MLSGDERGAIERHLRELDRLGEDLDVLDRDSGVAVVDDPALRRPLTIAGMNVMVAVIGEIRRFSSQQKLLSYFGLNPPVRQSKLWFGRKDRGPVWLPFGSLLCRKPKSRVPGRPNHASRNPWQA